MSFVPTLDVDEIIHDKGDTFSPWLTSDSTVGIFSLMNIKGDSSTLQENIRTLCTKFKDIFSNEPAGEPITVPAKIESFNLVVEIEKWRTVHIKLDSRRLFMIDTSSN